MYSPNYKGLGKDQTKGHRNLSFYALLGIADHLGQTPKWQIKQLP
jgi:hypothetical protein